ncbi:MAG: polyprenyl synthetase family protein [Bacteroidaceae bacterium]|jgi:geranylgeranyl diphosphate synthase type II|nr:polyprenyl synthetase family protein [Bacteroidaceae bacterium]MBO7267933.1 polyprenyl synthetase family protein [Bacteroidaceae bacterium]
MQQSFSQLLDKVNAHINTLDYAHEPMHLYEPVKYILSLGGKRIRPAMMLMAYNMYRDDVDKILDPALALEIYHNFTLLHDDLMDNADVRRGNPTVHKRWDANTAILSGDVMLSLADVYMSRVDDVYLRDVMSVFHRTSIEIAEGQQYDMDFETRDDVAEAEYIEMIRLKTSVLLACALKIGALLGGASKEDAEHLYQLGESLGLAFQLRDDYLDVYGNPKVFGKKIGGDILCNKKTYLYINALRLADKEQRAALDYWATASDIDPDEKIAAVTDIYNKVGLPAMSRKMEDFYYRRAQASLEALSVGEDKKQVLRGFMEALMERDV